MDVVGLDGGDHVLHLLAGADVDAAGGADVGQALDEGGLDVDAAEEADDGDDALVLDGLEALLQRAGAADLDHDVDAHAARQLARRRAPVCVLAVVDDVVGAELLHGRLLILGRRRRDDGCAGGFGELRCSC